MAEYSFAAPRFAFVAAFIVHVKSTEANLPRIFLSNPFRQHLIERLLSLATRAALTSERGDVDDTEFGHELC